MKKILGLAFIGAVVAFLLGKNKTQQSEWSSATDRL